jgi:hypothetical protein
VHGSPNQFVKQACTRSYVVTGVTQVTRVAVTQPLLKRGRTVTGR